ncbi:scoloptoxin SSD14-like [Tubulanus polymorphus]|uniref:scoloptoxin SSD14-like n=1 Tax=Tubulanus polymorphus TaxID=672921 RepID=UPI003DA4866B
MKTFLLTGFLAAHIFSPVLASAKRQLNGENDVSLTNDIPTPNPAVAYIRDYMTAEYRKTLRDDMKNCKGKESTFDSAAVVSNVPQCSIVGTDILRKNGSAVDAFIATAVCLGTINSQSSGIGGGFFMTYYKKSEKRSYALDAFSVAPNAPSQDFYVEHANSSWSGGLSIAVPGEVAGYWKAHQAFGRLTWVELFEPSIKLCESGYALTPANYMALLLLRVYDTLDPISRSIFIDPKTGDLYKAGEIIKRPTYCKTLKEIAEQGAATFYTGSLSKKILEDLYEQSSSQITAQDLKNYRAKWRKPIMMQLSENRRIHIQPPPSSGAVTAFILNILNGYNFTVESTTTSQQKSVFLQRYIEACKFAFAARSHLADQSFSDVKQIVAKMTSRQYAGDIRKLISDYVTQEPSYYDGVIGEQGKYGTSHISIVAPNGDAISATTTINYYYGSGVVGRRTNIPFNNVMNDFSIRNTPNMFHLTISPVNNVQPGKRPMSSSSPIIVTDSNGDVTTVIGASGGSKIPSTVSYVLAELFWLGKSLKESIDATRLHHQWLPNVITYEDDFFQTIYFRMLETIGHQLEPLKIHGSVVETITRDQNGRLHTYSDTRKDGCADGI